MGTRQDAGDAQEAPAAATKEEQAYHLHLCGYSYRAIGRMLTLDKDTVQRYVKAMEKECAPTRKRKREQLLRESVERLKNVQRAAWGHFVATDEAPALNIVTNAEKEIAKLQGLYSAEADGEAAGGITITITRRGAAVTARAEAEGADGNSDDAGEE